MHRNTLSAPWVLVVLVLAIAVIACNVPGLRGSGRVPPPTTPTPTMPPTDTSAPSLPPPDTAPPPLSSPTAESEAEAPTAASPPAHSLELGDALYSTDFQSGWVDYADESTRFAVTTEGYLVDVGASWAAWQFISRDFPARSYVETTAQARVCPGISSFGVIFRYQDGDNFYALAVDCTGGWILKSRQEGEWYAHLLSSTLRPDQFTGVHGVHRIGIRGDGPQLTVVYNGEALDTIEHQGFLQGDAGVFVEAATDDLMRVLFTELSVWALP